MKIRGFNYWGGALVFAVVIGFIAMDVIETVVAQGFRLPLAYTLSPDISGNGRVPFDVLESGPLVLLGSGYALSRLSIATAVLLLLSAAIQFSRHKALTTVIVQRLGFALIALFVWGGGAFLTMLGVRSAAEDLGVSGMWDGLVNTDSQTSLLWWVLVSSLSFLCVMTARSLKLQEDQEGLV